ncbi:MAG: tryptophan-rich sensory protein [Candidatus Omnitrophica bacterium]|nr:tryptophan-rich sensory protein [Candidatus Omnitrophota bacterium]MCM8816269.1 tryptophan-rich sensory protein [Candidatus Omnitrophota bacterium]
MIPSLKKNEKKIIVLIASIGICMSAGIIGSIFTSQSVDSWYKAINKPEITPPNWIFAPVWTLLYIMMGISLFFVWTSQRTARKTIALIIFFLQLILNMLWSAIFFGLQDVFLALVDIVLLWTGIFFTILAFRRVSNIAAYLLVPYILWVSFATFLNYLIFIMN